MAVFPAAGAGSGWEQFAGTGEIEFALKHFYLPGMEEQKNNARVLLAALDRNSKDVSGDYAFVPILLGRNWGIGMRKNREALPDPGYQRGARAQIPMRYAFGSLLVTLHAMAATRSGQGSYDTVLDVETEGLMEDLPKDINRQLIGDGTGRLGQVAGAPAGNVITLDNATLSAPKNANELSKYFENGMVIEGYTTAGVQHSTATVVSTTANTVTVDAIGTIVDNDELFIKGNRNQEVTGLLAAVSDTGTYEGINRATPGNERWKSFVNATATGITEAILQNIDTNVEKASGQTPNLIVTSFETRDVYAAILQANRRYVNTLDFVGGFRGPEFHGRPIIPDPDMPRGLIFFLNTKYISLYQQAGLQFMDDDGAILSRKSGYAAYEATLYWFFEMGFRRCNAHGVNRVLTD